MTCSVSPPHNRFFKMSNNAELVLAPKILSISTFTLASTKSGWMFFNSKGHAFTDMFAGQWQNG